MVPKQGTHTILTICTTLTIRNGAMIDFHYSSASLDLWTGKDGKKRGGEDVVIGVFKNHRGILKVNQHRGRRWIRMQPFRCVGRSSCRIHHHCSLNSGSVSQGNSRD